MPSIFMAASKHRFKVMKLQSKILMGRLSCAALVNLQSHTSFHLSPFTSELVAAMLMMN